MIALCLLRETPGLNDEEDMGKREYVLTELFEYYSHDLVSYLYRMIIVNESARPDFLVLTRELCEKRTISVVPIIGAQDYQRPMMGKRTKQAFANGWAKLIRDEAAFLDM